MCWKPANRKIISAFFERHGLDNAPGAALVRKKQGAARQGGPQLRARQEPSAFLTGACLPSSAQLLVFWLAPSCTSRAHTPSRRPLLAPADWSIARNPSTTTTSLAAHTTPSLRCTLLRSPPHPALPRGAPVLPARGSPSPRGRPLDFAACCSTVTCGKRSTHLAVSLGPELFNASTALSLSEPRFSRPRKVSSASQPPPRHRAPAPTLLRQPRVTALACPQLAPTTPPPAARLCAHPILQRTSFPATALWCRRVVA